MTLIAQDNRIGPARGIIATVGQYGARYDRRDVERWIRINRVVFKTEKIDVCVTERSIWELPALITYAKTLDCRLSIRTDCAFVPQDLARQKNAGVFDILLAPTPETLGALDAWLNAAREVDLPVRVQLPLALPDAFDAASTAEHYAACGVNAVSLAAHDPLWPAFNASVPKNIETIVETFERHAIECSVVHAPFCVVPESLWSRVINDRQFHNDHQFYVRESLDMLRQLYPKGRIVAKKALAIWLGRYTLMANPIDEKMLPWLLGRPWLRARVIAWHRLTRHKRLSRSVPAAETVTSEEEANAAIEKRAAERESGMSATCASCRLNRICNRDNHPGSEALQGFQPTAVEGETVTYPLQFAVEQPKYYDEIDEARRHTPERWDELAATANALMANTSPDRDIDSFEYSVDGMWCHQLPGGVRWYGLSNTEKISTPLDMLDPPFTISYMAGGGIAEYTGFSLGRDCKLVCPMEAYQHQIVLHVEADGSYVLLRDGKPVRPQQFEGHYYAPTRLGTRLQPRISMWNIDDSLVTQNVKIWNESLAKKPEAGDIKFTFISVCVRYARRLQAMLQSIAHQQNFDLSKIELIVAYLPDADSTEDILESFTLAHPEITVHRSTIAEDRARAKGFIINECLQKARGDWVVLLDADTMIPPNMLEEVSKHTDTANFIVPDGRKLLEPDTTAQILLGEVKPWECWNELLGTEGEFRYREMGGTPIGFCQIVRRSCFDEVKYYEVDHFEGADWQFSIDMREKFGDEVRLSGMPVLHLDHGGSKWYGTKRHF